jgi:hypothetical protein
MSYLSSYASLSLFLLQISVLFLLQAFPVLSDASATQSLYSEDLYKQQRSCAQCCFKDCTFLSTGEDLIAGDLSCPSPILNSCYCRGDLQAAAVSSVSSCVSSACSGDTVDIQSATSLYQAYCASNGYPPITTSTSTYTPSASQPQTTTSTNDLASTAVTSVVIVTQTLVSSSNPSSASPSTGESSSHHHHHLLLLLVLAALGLGALGLIL